MANWAWSDIDVMLVDGFDVTGMTLIDLQLPRVVADVEMVHPAGSVYPTALIPGTKKVDGPVVLRMPLDNAAGGSYAAFVTAAHVQNGVVCIGLQGNTLGKPYFGFKAHQLDYVQEPKVREVQKIGATWEVNGQMHEGKIVQVLAAKTADGNTESTPVNNAASSASGGEAHFQYTALTLDGHTALAVKLRHSPDGAAWADLGTFTSVTGTRGAQQLAISGTIDQYVAASWDFTGAGTSPTATIFVGLKRY